MRRQCRKLWRGIIALKVSRRFRLGFYLSWDSIGRFVRRKGGWWWRGWKRRRGVGSCYDFCSTDGTLVVYLNQTPTYAARSRKALTS
ncbi:hypothetical protein PSPO01_08617 [Paraphaeosphaeria sporulosa]